VNTLSTYASPTLGKLPVHAIDKATVIAALRPIWSTKCETARRVRGRIEAVLEWAIAHDLCQGDNPARWNLIKAGLGSQADEVRNHPALPYVELPPFMIALRGREGIAARALEFAILTAARSGEVRGATWGEIDWEARTWTVAGSRMKSGRPHRVALPATALAILKAMNKIRQSDYVFPGERRATLSSGAFDALLERMGPYRDKDGRSITAHGFRSTFKDWSRDRTNFPNELSEAALAHVIGDKTEAAYARSDLIEKRRQLMDAWAAYCDGAATDNVVPLRAASA
jgi:integrase